ncbi:hydrolase [Streptomyces sp. GMY02]|uniref:acyl-CoA dehydrogenase family protein n=1 Tax=Streptomyces sp. GMY02 TaxID=1333528 RepID=UPI001C2B85E0|nr:acyl-CoA dehydrogenase family protein [Streptomyces sp. GMY02]QXE35920.1 hydrolase [Streptomyces sp. GMY02]
MPADTPPDAGTGRNAETVRDLAAQKAADADSTRTLDKEVADAVVLAGFPRHFVAARWGGAEGSFAELTRAVLTVGEGCAATAWYASLAAYSSRFAAHLPQAGQQAVWGEGGPDAVIATGMVPGGRATRVADGWRLDGRWSYVSGIDFAGWALLCALVPAADGPPAMRFFAVPWGQWTVDPVWDNVGMRATGSHTVTVTDVLVPEHLSFDRQELFTGRNSSSDLSVHNVPIQAVSGLPFVTPAAGAAIGALKAAAATLTGRRRTPFNEVKLVRAAGRIDAARLLIEQNAEAADAHRFDRALLARGERNATYAAETLREAAGLLVALAGTAGLSESGALQRHWRDITTATSHVALQYETSAAKNYAAVLLGPAED